MAMEIKLGSGEGGRRDKTGIDPRWPQVSSWDYIKVATGIKQR